MEMGWDSVATNCLIYKFYGKPEILKPPELSQPFGAKCTSVAKFDWVFDPFLEGGITLIKFAERSTYAPHRILSHKK